MNSTMKCDPSKIEPIFVVGSPRSGTTVLMRALETLDGFYSPHVEGHLTPWLLEGVDRVVKNASHFPQPFLPTSICTGENFDKLLTWLARAVDGFMKEVGNISDDESSHWIDKTPDLPQLRRLPLLQRMFPKCNVIFIYRHPRDVVLSTRKVWNPNTSDKDLLKRWTQLHEEYRKKIRPHLDLKRVLEIQQERLATCPEMVSRTLVDFLGLSENNFMELSHFFQAKRINRKPDVQDKSFTYLDNADKKFLKLVDSICGSEMSHWGYTSANQDFMPNLKTSGSLSGNKSTVPNLASENLASFEETSNASSRVGKLESPPSSPVPLQKTTIGPEEFLRSYRIVSKLYPFIPSMSLWRSWEHAAFQGIRLREPVLDLGCGDGRFFKLLWPNLTHVIGLDPDSKAIVAASASGSYPQVVRAKGNGLPFATSSFSSVFANCSLEHMSDLEGVMREVYRILRKDGSFACSVVTDKLLEWSSIPKIAKAIGCDERKSRQIQQDYKAYHHLVNPLSIHQWLHILYETGFTVDTCVTLVPELTARLFSFMDNLWHLRQGGREMGTLIEPYLQEITLFPQAFGDILANLLKMENAVESAAGVVLIAYKRGAKRS